jgi:tetratricopeptide (TPR) repeat protein
MRSKESTRSVWIAMLVLSTAAWIACTKSGSDVSASSDGGKIPVTTSSDEARKEFLTGRDLSERLLGQESLQHFDKALALDPDFASAELARANNSPTAKEFFEHQKKAVGLATKASNGEKLLILANEAGANGVTEIQKEYLDQLVTAYPNDERAQFNLGNYYFAQQELDQALTHYKKAAELAPNYSQVYNILGYCYRQKGDYANSEQAFKKYIELIPNDPNPYDSYAELLLKMGRYDESIAQYRKALSIDSHFNPSRFGLSADYMYSGKPEEAATELQTMADQARNDGELRTAFFAMAVAAADGGKFDQALAAMDKEYAVAEKKGDAAAMAADLQAKGNILEQVQKYDAAAKQFDRSLQLVEDSNLSQEIKNNATLLHHFNAAAIAIAKKDLAAAKTHADEFRKGAEATKNDGQLKQAHELVGRIALAEKDYGKAIAELEQANQQNPQNLYRLSQAYRAQGDAAKSQDYLKKAADFNSLPALNYAFIRVKAQKEAGQKG